MKSGKTLVAAMVVVLMCGLSTTVYAAPAQADIDFYNGKLVTYIVATKPGGGYDAYARLIGKYMQKNIPGSTVIIKNVPGAGHIIGANETFMAKPDGLTIGTFNTGLIYSQILGQQGVKFDLTKYTWIAKANSELRVFLVGIKTPFKTIQEVIANKEPMKIPASGVGSQDFNETLIMKEALPANFQAIPGYAGREGEMAILRGECVGVFGSYTGLLGFIQAKECRVLLQYGSQKAHDLPNVPHISELNLSPKGKALADVVNNINQLGRITAAPPGVPAGRAEVLIDAYKKAVTDPDLLKEAKTLGLDLDPLYGNDVAKLMHSAINQPPEVITLLKSVVKLEQ
jgi:tripartite-type tricarboxylate transporter receptor subunit TctC